MQNKTPQIVDGDHVLKLGKDEIIRRLFQSIGRNRVVFHQIYGVDLSIPAQLRLTKTFSENQIQQLISLYCAE